MNVRSTSVGADLGHWKKYAEKNKSVDKGHTGEHPPRNLATPVQKKATGGAVKKRADFARGGKAKHFYGGGGERSGQGTAYGTYWMPEEEIQRQGERRGGRAQKRARGGRLTAGAVTGVGREEKAEMHKR